MRFIACHIHKQIFIQPQKFKTEKHSVEKSAKENLRNSLNLREKNLRKSVKPVGNYLL